MSRPPSYRNRNRTLILILIRITIKNGFFRGPYVTFSPIFVKIGCVVFM